MEDVSLDSFLVDDEQVSDSNSSIVGVNIEDQFEYSKLVLTKEEEANLFIRGLRIQYLNKSYKYQSTMQTLEIRLQDLTQDNEEERLMNIQYQDHNRDLMAKNERLKSNVKQLTEEKKELTERLKQYERGLKRKLDSEDSAAKHNKSPDTSTSDEKEADKVNDRNVISELRQDNAKLLRDKDEIKRHYDNCYKHYVELKKKWEKSSKDNQELKSMKVAELTKDPRITSLICKDKEQELKECKEKYQKLKVQHRKCHPQTNVDMSKVKRERSSNEEIVIDDSPKRDQSNELAELRKKAEGQKILENTLKKKESELAEKLKANKEYCNALNVSKKKLIETNRTLDVLKKEREELDKTYNEKIKCLEHEIKELKVKQQKSESDLEQLNKDLIEERQKMESDRLQIIKDADHKHGLEALKLRNQHEVELNKILTLHVTENNNLKNELQKATNAKDSLLAKEIDKLKQDYQTLQNDQEYNQAELNKYKKLYSQCQEESLKKMNCANNLTKEIEDMRDKNTLLSENNHFLREKIIEKEKMILERNYYIQRFIPQQVVQPNLQGNLMMPGNRTIPNNIRISPSVSSPRHNSPPDQMNAASPVPTIPTIQTTNLNSSILPSNMNNSIQTSNMNNLIPTSNINPSSSNDLPPTYQSIQQLKNFQAFAQQTISQTFVQPFFGPNPNQGQAPKDNGTNKKK